MGNNTLADIGKKLEELDLRGLEVAIRDKLATGIPPADIKKSLSRKMVEIGRKYVGGEIYLPRALITSEIFEGVLEKFDLPEGGLGRVAIGVVGPQVHEVGKNMVAAWLRSAGFEVLDLGVLVPPEKFIEVVRAGKADILAMSARLSPAIYAMSWVLRRLEEEGLRKNVKVIIGGTAVSEEIAEEMGADSYASDFMKAVDECRKLIGKEGG
jgi:5-methyltetrahydrofolate--homocysteine methyltransferase